jgi:hypothetical protein
MSKHLTPVRQFIFVYFEQNLHSDMYQFRKVSLEVPYMGRDHRDVLIERERTDLVRHSADRVSAHNRKSPTALTVRYFY